MARGEMAVGTTMRGIGPAYSDKYGYNGIRIGDLLDHTTLREKVAYNCKIKNALLRGIDGSVELSEDEVFEELREGGRCLAPFVTDTFELIHRELEAGSKILAEGAQGTLLDVDLGNYQFVTSSSTTAGGSLYRTGNPAFGCRSHSGGIQSVPNSSGSRTVPLGTGRPGARPTSGIGQRVWHDNRTSAQMRLVRRGAGSLLRQDQWPDLVCYHKAGRARRVAGNQGVRGV